MTTEADDWAYPLHLQGAATPLFGVQLEGRDYGAELRAVFKEVTGEDAPEPVRPRIGFLP